MIPLRDNIPSDRRPVVTYSLMVLNVLAFFLTLATGPHMPQFITTFGFIPARFFAMYEAHPEQHLALYLPFLTTMFLHGGWLHLIANMWTLFIFGDNVEDRLGHLRYLIFYLACGVAGTLLHAALTPNSWIPLVGASGAIAGVMGAYFLLFRRSMVLVFIPFFFVAPIVEVPAYVFLGVWFLLQFFSGAFSILGPRAAQSGGVAFWAHVGGFVAGVVFILLLSRIRLLPRR
ncbi:MAG: rhomboid family intramembrane serine protease [Desulfobacca sp.]|uniref:rhomboid family intramembrane serine protease n=1 Tax=Desulfobacca sp. TaxID=2067990 RepID=UPI00404AB5ED